MNGTNDDDPNGRYAFGAYAAYRRFANTFTDNYVYGMRRFPYTTDNTVNPLTWADVDQFTDGVLDAPLETAFWDGELVAPPFWANTQLLWYRKSVAEAAGEQQQTAVGDQVRVHDPGQAGLAELEVFFDRGQRDVHDRLVQHDHQHPCAQHDQREPARIRLQSP